MSIRRLQKQAKEDGQEDENEYPEGPSDEGTNVITVEDEEMGEVIDSISSGTALDILESVHESPKVSTELAEELGMTTQNARYHLDNLEEAGLVKAEEICYSEKGRVMSVYEPAESPLVLLFGKDTDGVQRTEVKKG